VRLAVATVTGHGLKDPERAVAVSPAVTQVRPGDEAPALHRLLLE
jgi:hypothetical protein